MFKRTARRLFNDQKQEVLDNIDSTVKGFDDTATKALLAELLFNKAGSLKKWVAAFEPIYNDAVQQAGDQAMLLIAASGFTIDDPNIKRYFDERPTLVAGVIDDETEKQLRATLSEGINAGESIPQLKARVESVYGAAAGFRAERIARTESIHAGSFGNNAAWRQSGEVESKEWYTARDEMVCPFCAEMDGRVIGIDSHYWKKGETMTVPKVDAAGNPVLDDNDEPQVSKLKLDFESIKHPPLHSNCRCTELPILS